MNSFIYHIYRIIVPKPIRTRILKKNLRKKILDHFSSLPGNKINSEQIEVVEYLKNNPVTIFPYSFSQNYSPEMVEAKFDPSNGMPYVMQEGKRLYFRKRWSIKRIQRAYADLLREQDPKSPHCYLSEEFRAGPDDVIADIGAAEGNFSLSVIEKVKKIYLVEYDREWIRALNATFAPWKQKVEIISKYVSDYDDHKHITIDTLIRMNNDITFLKTDVDGDEQKVLDGASDLLSGKRKLKIALCTYHKADDEKDFTRLLENSGFSVTPSGGYMIHYYDKKLACPWLRKGLIRAKR
jgi:predicted RNA methylase